jgi:hypothetical protein
MALKSKNDRNIKNSESQDLLHAHIIRITMIITYLILGSDSNIRVNYLQTRVGLDQYAVSFYVGVPMLEPG